MFVGLKVKQKHFLTTSGADIEKRILFLESLAGEQQM